ncbi:MAG: DNA repair protein RadC [Pseudanabaenaceae cyanobacterium SKYGB_i_bin29]|nr:DNA repair protein RadC [Pseudanabaenaceae cyanobacterium SKYG29]MDW8420820.1 DNA repair protein RadC [Pseudanabaenaceae cyanobacterium SKYGB_i_bin29]
MTYSLRIKDLTAADRPRERLLAQGVSALSNAELLAILLGTGSGKLSAVGLGQLILQTIAKDEKADPLPYLQNISAEVLMQIPGVGPAKATTILAAIELGKRVFFSRPPDRTEVTEPSIAANALSHILMWQPQERLAVLLLDHRNRIIAQKLITIGTVNETIAHPRDIFGEVLRQGAVKLILGHNHPSGNTDPSPEDIRLTRQLLQAAKILDIPLLDHLILGNGTFTSMRSVTNLWEE